MPGGEARFRTIPPIRGGPDREGLWEGLRSGLIDGIGSGHLPSAPLDGRGRKDGSPVARPGIASLQLMLPAIWTEARKRGFTADDLARWTAGGPARVAGLGRRKGSIAPGADADLVVVDPEATFVVDPNHLFHRHPATPYEGRTLSGVVEMTILRGRVVFESGRFHGEPCGMPILRLDDTLPVAAGLDRLNKAGEAEALEILIGCCGSSRWAFRVAALRPFRSEDEAIEAAERVWSSLERADRIEAYRAHPRIVDRGATRARQTRDGPVNLRDPEHAALLALVQADLTYEAKFGHPFLVTEQDAPPSHLLAKLRKRLANTPEEEERIASEDQATLFRRAIHSLIP